MKSDLRGKASLITGASRGIGAATALKLAELGCNIVLNYRSKSQRAMEVAGEVAKCNVQVVLAQRDITNPKEVAALIDDTRREMGQLDYLILNASGGMEKDKADDYAMVLNRDAQKWLAVGASEIMPAGSRIVFVTSHWAHFYGSKPVMPGYEDVASSKRAGEDALRQYSGALASKGISLVVVSGDLIEGTITPKLLQRSMPGMIEARRKEAGGLPSVDDFATAIVEAAVNGSLPSGHTVYVGSTEF